MTSTGGGDARPSAPAAMRFLAVIVLVGLGLRLWDFTTWWANPDEGLYTLIVTQPTAAAFWREVLATAHPPLYFVLLRGLSKLSPDFQFFRVVALVSGCLAMVAFFFATRSLARVAFLQPGSDGEGGDAPAAVPVLAALRSDSTATAAGLMAAAMIALGPRTVTMSQVVRPYMLLVLLLALSLFALLEYLAKPTHRTLAVYAVATSLATALHYSAPFAIAAFGALVLADGWARGWRRRSWVELLLAHLAPAIVLLGLYAIHLRVLMASSMAANAQQGWLVDFMIGGARDAWLSLVGLQSMVVGIALAPIAAVTFAAALVFAAWARSIVPAVLGSVALLIGGGVAAAQAYPLGATRHSAWFLVCGVPVTAWMVAALVGWARLAPRQALAAVGALAMGGVGLGVATGSAEVPREISERVIRRVDLESMGDVIDPTLGPRRVIMSTETYQTLFPLIGEPAQHDVWGPDGIVRRFQWGVRDVFVVPTRDFTALPREIGFPNHLYTTMERIPGSFPDARRDPGEPVLILAVGWRSTGMDDLVALARSSNADMGSAVSVPGATAVYLVWDAYVDALGVERSP